MKKFAITCAAIITIFLLTFTLTGCAATYTSVLELNAQKTTLEEASNVLGVPMPVPTYLPVGYEIREVYVQDRTVRLLISDEAIGRKLVTHTDAAGTRQRYEVQCKMEMSVRWYPEGGAPIKLPVEKVQINESRGFLQDRGDHRAIWWDCFPEPGQEGMYELVLAASKRVSKAELIKVAESVSIPLIHEYPEEVMRAVYEELTKELFDERNLYDVIPQMGYSSRTINLGFAGEADTEIVDLVRSIIGREVPGVFLVVEEHVSRFQEPLLESPEISREQAIEIATNMLTDLPVAAVVARADVRAELHGWYWEVTFDNVDATYDELMPFPLKPPPPGGSASKAYPGIYQSVVLTVDTETGNPLSAGASKEPRPGPYVSKGQAIGSARGYMAQIPEAWIEGANVAAYLRGDTWIVLFWEDGSKDNRIKVSVDAVTGTATGASRG